MTLKICIIRFDTYSINICNYQVALYDCTDLLYNYILYINYTTQNYSIRYTAVSNYYRPCRGHTLYPIQCIYLLLIYIIHQCINQYNIIQYRDLTEEQLNNNNIKNNTI